MAQRESEGTFYGLQSTIVWAVALQRRNVSYTSIHGDDSDSPYIILCQSAMCYLEYVYHTALQL